MPGAPTPPHAVRLGDWIRQAIAQLDRAGRGCPDATVEFWAAHALGDTRTGLRLRDRDALSPDQRARLDHGLDRLCRGEPLQYLCGETSFYGRTFRCDPRALIPRPETEELVERVLARLRARSATAPRLLDVGTGTGCIAITLALEFPSARVKAVDLSGPALDLARDNAARLGADVRFFQGDLLQIPALAGPPGPYDLVVSNPPYISQTDWEALTEDVRDHEPRTALAAGPTGLEIYQRLLPQAWQALVDGGEFAFEIGEQQGPALLKVAREQGFTALDLHRDLSGRIRFLTGAKG